MPTVIRQACIDDKSAIWDFLKKAYGDASSLKIPDRWNWEYLENPYVDEGGKELAIFIAINNGEIVGQMCATPCQIKIGDEIHQIAPAADLIVLPHCRGKGIAEKLVKAIAEHYKLYMSISCAPTSRRIFDRLGCNTIESIPCYKRLVKVNPEIVFRFLMRKTKNHLYLRRLANIGCSVWMDKIISFILNIAIGIRYFRERRAKEECRTSIRKVDRFGDEIDQLWNATNHKFDIIVKRDQKYLNWRFTNNTQLRYSSFVSTRDGVPNGYIVLREPDPIELDIGIIVDLFVAPDDNKTVEYLIKHAINFFDKSVTVIECHTSQREFQRALSKLGFFKIKKTEPIFLCTEPELINKIFKSKNNWFLSKADHDWDQLRPA